MGLRNLECSHAGERILLKHALLRAHSTELNYVEAELALIVVTHLIGYGRLLAGPLVRLRRGRELLLSNLFGVRHCRRFIGRLTQAPHIEPRRILISNHRLCHEHLFFQ